MSAPIINVGVTGTGYPEQRNIIGLPFRNVRIGRHRDPVQWLDLLHFKITGRLHPWTHAVHNDLGLCRFDVLHFFNKVSFSRTPWVSTFESFIPRYPAPGHSMISCMARPACVRLIAMSERARRIEEARLERFPGLRDDIMDKTMVLHPPQTAMMDDVSTKPALGDLIRLVLVGHLFFLKGGLEVLRVVDRMLARGAPLHLTIVSTLETGDHVTHSGETERQEALRLIGRHPSRIVHHGTLPNSAVLGLFRTSDIALLPTYHDSYGYSVLEGQAHGCPAITTDVAALPEINDEHQGWLVHVPKNDLGEGTWRTKAGRDTISRLIEEQLEAHLSESISDPSLVRRKGAAALRRIREEHSPDTRAMALEAIYAEAMGHGRGPYR